MTMKYAGCGTADMLEKELHHRGGGRRQNQGGHFPFGWCYGGIDVGILAHNLPWGAWPDARGRPRASGDPDAAKPTLIFGHLQHGRLDLWGTGGDSGLDRLREGFLNAACAARIGFGMDGTRDKFAPGVAVQQTKDGALMNGVLDLDLEGALDFGGRGDLACC